MKLNVYDRNNKGFVPFDITKVRPSPNGGGNNTQFPVTVKPFWASAMNLLPHNIYLSTKLPVTDTNNVTSNIIASGGIFLMSSAIVGGPEVLIGAGIVLWGLWIVDLPHGTRKFLTSSELWMLIE